MAAMMVSTNLHTLKCSHSLRLLVYVYVSVTDYFEKCVLTKRNEQQPQIILLKEGTDTSQGKAQLVSNINACTAVADVVRSTLGPRGMDKLIHDDKGTVTISNDGATIMKLLDIVHPAAKILVDIAKSQDSEVGDGTTTVVLLAAEFLREAKPFIEDGVHPQNLIRSFRNASYKVCHKPFFQLVFIFLSVSFLFFIF